MNNIMLHRNIYELKKWKYRPSIWPRYTKYGQDCDRNEQTFSPDEDFSQ